MKYDDEVKLIITRKLFARLKKRVRKLTNDNPEAEYQIMQVSLVISKLAGDVYNYHPSCHVAILILAESIKEMLEEARKMQTDEVIYL